MFHNTRFFSILLVPAFLTGCSINRIAVNSIGSSLANSSGSVFASDNDPQLIRDALPFSLKLMETLLAESPENSDLLLATCSGFTQYAYAFVEQEARELEDDDYRASEEGMQRARKLYIRARDYGLRGLDVTNPGFQEALRADPAAAVATTTKADVPLLYWTASAWGALISLSIDEPATIAEIGLMESLIYRAYALEPDYDYGAIHGFLITYEMSKSGGDPPPEKLAREHFNRAVALTRGQSASPYLSLAEAVSVPNQDRAEFEDLLRQALAIDPDIRMEWRLINTIMQERARWLLARIDRIFLD
ncbi:MAG: TRAP transporter TatT component family protein [Opitutaceae bacterium]